MLLGLFIMGPIAMLTMEAVMAFFCITFQWLFLSVSAVTYPKLFSRFMVKGCSIMWSIKPLLGLGLYKYN